MEKLGVKIEPFEYDKYDINLPKLFVGIASLLTGAVAGAYSNLSTAFTKEINNEQRAFLIVSQAINGSLKKFIEELNVSEEIEILNEELLDNLYLEVKELFVSKEYHLDLSNSLDKAPYLQDLKNTIRKCLELVCSDISQIDNILNRFDSYFANEIYNAWNTNFDFYRSLYEQLKNNPFNELVREQFEWDRYSHFLVNETYQPVFRESFSLQDIYIPLRAYYRDEKDEKYVIWVEEEIIKWSKTWTDKKDAFRVLTGGPGFGKSTTLKMLAAKLLSPSYKVLFIPIHRFNFKENISESIELYFKDTYFFQKKESVLMPDKLLIIFDGLDELFSSGGTLRKMAEKFVSELKRYVDTANSCGNKSIKVILSGRDVIIKENSEPFLKKQILHLLEYFIEKYNTIKDDKGILNKDQRDEWWKKYAQLTNKDYSELPEVLKHRSELNELTSQPLLNYLVALSFSSGKLDVNSGITINNIYDTLLSDVYHREYDGGKLKSIEKIDYPTFVRVMEEIAIASWHSNGRVVSMDQINERLDNSDLKEALAAIMNESKSGTFILLASFYFRQAENWNNQSFEFTHKSFGEYLIARRIVKRVIWILKKRDPKIDQEDKITIGQALMLWLELFNKNAITWDIIKFIEHEITLNIEENLFVSYQAILCELINSTLKNGFPIDATNNFNCAINQAACSELALFICHSIIANHTRNNSKIEYNNESIISDLVHRNMLGHLSIQISSFFNNIELSPQYVRLVNLYRANLYRANLYRANLQGVDLQVAKLEGANLVEANLVETKLYRANLVGADLRGANLISANLIRANLRGAILVGAILVGANLQEADLKGADLRGADLERANLEGADLNDVKNANFEGAILSND